MGGQTLQQFLNAQTGERPHAANPAAFEVDSERFLQVNLGWPGSDGAPLSLVWIKMGSMVGYKGEVKFEREGILEHGFAHAMKKTFTAEGATLVKASCKPGSRSELFLADEGKRVLLLRLTGDAISVNGDDLLAFEPSIKHKITMMRKLSAIVSAGLFNVRLEGHGVVAILTHGEPLTLVVGPDLPPVFTDPEATVAWSASLSPYFHVDVSFKTFLGRSSGDSFQMKFDGKAGPGFVIVQPYEEHPPPPEAPAVPDVPTGP